VIGTDPERAAREIAELETVARRSLTEVRQAVTSYRQPSLAAELVSSRRMLASAGIECQLRVPDAYSLPPAVDALLAWTVREGATNIVRHSAAGHAEITIELTDTEATVGLSDDGMGPRGNGLRAIANTTGTVAAGAGAGGVPGGTGATGAGGTGTGGTGTGAGGTGAGAGGTGAGAGAGGTGAGMGGTGAGAGGTGVPGGGTSATDGVSGASGSSAAAGAGGGPAGSGLAGLAERAARLGGTLSAGEGEDGGFWLRVNVPLTGLADGTAAGGTAAGGTAAGGTAAGGTAAGGTAADPGPGTERMPS
jgi:hypothetical protein